jgi:hypothetical protein
MSIAFSSKSAHLFSTAHGVVIGFMEEMIEDLSHACTIGVLRRSSRKSIPRSGVIAITILTTNSASY